jgi:hypothetical protein
LSCRRHIPDFVNRCSPRGVTPMAIIGAQIGPTDGSPRVVEAAIGTGFHFHARQIIRSTSGFFSVVANVTVRHGSDRGEARHVRAGHRSEAMDFGAGRAYATEGRPYLDRPSRWVPGRENSRRVRNLPAAFGTLRCIVLRECAMPVGCDVLSANSEKGMGPCHRG